MFKTESYTKGVLYSTGLNFIARAIGFLNTLIIAYFFGANSSTDIYFMVLSVALIISSIINGNDYLILIPEAMKLRERESEKRSQQFLNFFLYAYACIGILLSFLIITSPVFFYSLFSKFERVVLVENKSILFFGAAIIVFQLLNNFLNAILSSYKFFTAPILTGLVNSIFSITITLLLHDKLGIVGTIMAIAIGSALNFFLLIYLLKKYQLWNFSLVAWMKDKIVWTNLGLMQVNILPLWVRNSIVIYFLSGFGKGLITSLNLGQQLAVIPEILIINQFVSIAGIKLNELHALGNKDLANQTYLKLAKIGLAVTTIIASLVFLLSDYITHFFYSNRSLTPENLENITLVLGYLILLLPIKFIDILSTNVFTAFQEIKGVVKISFITHLVITIAIYFLVRSYGLSGYLGGSGLHFGLMFILYFFLFQKTIPFIEYKKILLYFFNMCLLNGLVFLPVFFINIYFFGNIQNSFVRIICITIIYVPLLLIANELTGISDFLRIRKYKEYFRRGLIS